MLSCDPCCRSSGPTAAGRVCASLQCVAQLEDTTTSILQALGSIPVFAHLHCSGARGVRTALLSGAGDGARA